MTKYSKQKRDECAAFIRERGLSEWGGVSVENYCKAMDMTPHTHYRWLERYPEYAAAIADAKTAFKEGLGERIVHSLARAAEGYKDVRIEEYGLVNPDDGKLKTIKAKKITTNVPPNVAAGIFLLSNLDPEHYQTRYNGELSLRERAKEPSEMSIDELNAEIARLEKVDGEDLQQPAEE